MSNHLIIGLGGTGGKVIRELRKSIYRDWRPKVAGAGNDPANVSSGNASTQTELLDPVASATPPGLKVEYLHVDTSRDQMGDNDPKWKVMGKNLQLNPASQCHLKSADFGARLADIAAYPAFAPWVGKTENWSSMSNKDQGTAETEGGQKRRMGRFLFGVNAGDFLRKVQTKVRQIQSGAADAGVRFHLISGLAGGTGSGSLIDTICLIRAEFPDTQRFPIILYLLLPEDQPQPGWDTGNYHANGYAALWELNALAVGKYVPHNLAGQGERFDERKIQGPFKACFLISNENNYGAPFDIGIEVPQLMAETLYQTLMADSVGAGEEVNRVVSWVNMATTNEGRGPDGKAERSRLFASFGIKKICYPEEEVREYIGYRLSSQTLLQMLYNHWAQGYLNEAPTTLAVEGLVGDSVTQKGYNLDREAFFLERQFSTETVDTDQPSWRAFEVDWKAFVERLSADVIRDEGNWVEILMRRCEERQKRSFRGERGVLDYFSWKKDRIVEYARLVVSGIEEDLSGAILEGKRSLTEVEAILRALVAMLEKREEEWQRQSEENSTHAAKQRLLAVENSQRFEDLGPLARRMPGNKERIFETGKSALITHFSLSSRVSAWEFASAFAKSVRVELLRRADHVANVIAAFRKAVDFCLRQSEDRRPEERNLQSTEVVWRLFNGDEVTRYVDALIGNKEFQDSQAREARDLMVQHLMQGRSGLLALPHQNRDELLDILAQSSHSTLVKFDAEARSAGELERNFGRLLSVSIVDKLRERYEGNPDLMKREIKEHVTKSGYLLRLNEAEHGKQGPGADFSNENKRTSLIIMLPEANKEDDPFIRELRSAFEGSVGDGNFVEFIDIGDKKKHEISILSFVQLFPLRYVELLGKLQERYETRRKSDPTQSILQLHTEDPAGQFPPLFVPPVRETAGPALLLGLALGTIRPKVKGGVPGTVHDELVCVDAADDPLFDLGAGFEGSIPVCGTREIYEKVTQRNLIRTTEWKVESGTEKLDETRSRIVSLSKEISANDDDIRKSMRPMEESALEILDAYLKKRRS